MKKAVVLAPLGLLVLAGILFVLAKQEIVTVPGTAIADPRQGALTDAMKETRSGDPRNSDVAMKASFLGLGSDVLVIDLSTKETGAASPADLFRVLWSFSGRVRSRTFTEVRLLTDGRHQFSLSGDDFKKLGTQHEQSENPMYVIRTFPEKLRRPGGETAFPQWSGGALGVMSKQMEDFNAFAKQWLTHPAGAD